MSDITRKLATIERISAINPIPDADAIEGATIRGWSVVVKKGEHQVGDLVVYCEIDSVLPERPEFEFLRPRGFRIRTIKLRNQISQGIIFPLHILDSVGQFQSVLGEPEYDLLLLYGDNKGIPIVEGENVTELLGVTKYEPQIPACLGGIAKGSFPSHSIRTDEERIQNLVDIYDEYKTKYTWTATEKLDGCLDENTLIETEDGEKSIKEICETKYSGKVRTFNHQTLKEEFQKILGHFIKEPSSHEWFEIELEDGHKIRLTGNHEVWLPELLCWRRIDELDGDEEFLLKN
jgi:hypothetical protein